MRSSEQGGYRPNEAGKISRRTLLRAGVVAGVAAIAGLVDSDTGRRQSERLVQPESERDKLIKEYAGLEQQLTVVYEQLKPMMAQLQKHVRANSQYLPKESLDFVLAPLQLFEHNLGNPQWNHYGVLRQALIRPRAESTASLDNEEVPDPDFFRYRLLDARSASEAASYNWAAGSLALEPRPDGRPLTMAETLAVYHELVHAMQDRHFREEARTPEALVAYHEAITPQAWDGRSERVPVNLPQELEADLATLLVLNAITQGKLAQSASQNALDEAWYARHVGPVTGRDAGEVHRLQNLAQVLYSTGAIHPAAGQEMAAELRRYYQHNNIQFTEWETLKELIALRRKQ